MEWNDIEKLALAQAVYNAVGAEVKTKDPSNLRGRVDAYYREAYELHHGKSYDVQVAGQKVGTYSITTTKPKKGRLEEEFELKDDGEFSEWLGAQSLEDICTFAAEHHDEYALWHFERTGEVPEGCTLLRLAVQDEDGGEISRTTFKVDAQKVAQALGASLGEGVAHLLEGGIDD